MWLAVAATLLAPNPHAFVRNVTNPWFPLRPGTTYLYRGTKDGQPSRDVMTVTDATRTIQGVRAIAVRDLLYLRGRLEERTTDWYAQDRRGNVWYGEATAELDRHGRVKTRAGSWLAGRNGGRAGIFMPGRPRVGQTGRQEYLRGQASDHFRIVRFGARVAVPYASSHRALLTAEWTPLEPGVLDHKYYLRGVGTALEITVHGPTEVNRLVSVRRPKAP